MYNAEVANGRALSISKVGLLGSCAAIAISVAGTAQAQQEIQLNEVVVTAGGFEQQLRDAPASISVITAEELQKGAFSDLTQALTEVQGVAITGIGNEKDVYIRGLSGSYTLMLVDGRRVSTRDARPNGSAGIEQSHIPPISAIDRIEVVRGPMSSLYGSDAMGGVINVITKKADQVWSGSVTVEGTAPEASHERGSQQLSFNVMGPLVKDRLTLQLWGRYHNRDADKARTDVEWTEDGDTVLDSTREKNLAGRLSFTPVDNHTIGLELGTSRINSTNSTAPDSWTKHDRDYAVIDYSTSVGSAKFDFSLKHEKGSRLTPPSLDSASRTMVQRNPVIKHTTIDGKVTLPWDFAGSNTLVAGFEHTKSTLDDSGKFNHVRESFGLERWAVYAENEWRMRDDFALTAGLRYDDHEVYGGHFSPRLYAVWNTNDNLTIKGGVSTGFKAPDFRSIAPGYYYPTQQGSGRIMASRDLKPEETTSYELSALWDNNSGVVLGATAFRTDFKNKITNYNTQNFVNVNTGDITDRNGATCNAAALRGRANTYCLWQNRNIGKAVIQGVELTGSWKASDAWSFRGNYTFTDSKQKSGDLNGYALERTPRNSANLRADWTTPVEGLASWASVNYHGKEIANGARIGNQGKLIATVPNSEGGTYSVREYKAYTTVDIGTSYNVSDNVTINAAIYNVLDKEVSYNEAKSTIEGRRLWVGVTTRF